MIIQSNRDRRRRGTALWAFFAAVLCAPTLLTGCNQVFRDYKGPPLPPTEVAVMAVPPYMTVSLTGPRGPWLGETFIELSPVRQKIWIRMSAGLGFIEAEVTFLAGKYYKLDCIKSTTPLGEEAGPIDKENQSRYYSCKPTLEERQDQRAIDEWLRKR